LRHFKLGHDWEDGPGYPSFPIPSVLDQFEIELLSFEAGSDYFLLDLRFPFSVAAGPFFTRRSKTFSFFPIFPRLSPFLSVLFSSYL